MYTVAQIAQMVNGTIVGDASITIKGITNIANPQKDFITFIDDPEYLKDVEASPIACVITPATVTTSSKTLITCAHPKLAFAQLLAVFFPQPTFSKTVSPQAFVAKNAQIGAGTTVEEFVSVKDNALIGKNVVLMSGCYVGRNVTIGDGTILHPHVTLYDNTKVGANVIIHSNAVIGADGFGYVDTGTERIKVPQVGNVVIEDNVEIGACATIDRATMGSTVIRTGVKIDNLCQIAHNVDVGAHTTMSSLTGISGSCKIGTHCTLAGAVGMGDHVELGNNVIIAAQAGIPSKKKIRDNQIFLGSPARPIEQAKKQFGAMAILPRVIDKVGALDERVKKLESEKQ